jgi:hypothetical protein
MVKQLTAQTDNPAGHKWNRMRGLLRTASLDHQLASGTPPNWNRALAARARYITGTESCRALAEDWRNLVRACRQPKTVRSPRTPLCRGRVLAAETEIHDLLATLSEARLDSAAGVAMASLLLRDGTGPVYNRQSDTDLTAAIMNATTHIIGYPTAANLT